jgi:MFS family permease
MSDDATYPAGGVPSDDGESDLKASDWKVIAASSFGTIFEWYDFFLYGALATHITRHFFAGVNETTGIILALLAFAAGFAVRPFGALLFGRLGDVMGRKKVFVATLALMGAATFCVGLLPGYASIGALAPALLVALRMLQGLAVGGVYGGAATYVAEHAPRGRRGFYTSWIQTTATAGLLLSLLVILGCRSLLGDAVFAQWGWRVPFLLSVVLLAITFIIQQSLAESPTFRKMKAGGGVSANPWRESFGRWTNLRLVLIVLFGAVVGQAVAWYTGQFYAMFFLERVLKVDGATTNLLVSAALIIVLPLYVFFGWLSDRIGRKPLVVGGCLIATFCYFPVFHGLTAAANPALAAATTSAPVGIVVDPSSCSFQFDPVGKAAFDTPCDIVRSFLARTGVGYAQTAQDGPGEATLVVGTVRLAAFDGRGMSPGELRTRRTAWEAQAASLLGKAGYPLRANPAEVNYVAVIAWLTLLSAVGAMIYAPLAAMLVELFPTNIRYTAMSLPYHIGNGWFGGFMPTTAFAIVAATGDIYSGLWYPAILSFTTFVIGMIFLPETRHADDDGKLFL